jgi:hypothetical protein
LVEHAFRVRGLVCAERHVDGEWVCRVWRRP